MKILLTIIGCLFVCLSATSQCPIEKEIEQLYSKNTGTPLIIFGRISDVEGYADITKFCLINCKGKISYISCGSGIKYKNAKKHYRISTTDINYLLKTQGAYYIAITRGNEQIGINTPYIMHRNGEYYYLKPSDDIAHLFCNICPLKDVLMSSIVIDLNKYSKALKQNNYLNFGYQINPYMSMESNITGAIQNYYKNHYGLNVEAVSVLKLKVKKNNYDVLIRARNGQQIIKKQFKLDKNDLWIMD